MAKQHNDNQNQTPKTYNEAVQYHRKKKRKGQIINPSEAFSKEEMKKIDKEMKSRVQHMRQECQMRGLDLEQNDKLHQINPWEYFVLNRPPIAWCNVFKSGSSRYNKLEQR